MTIFFKCEIIPKSTWKKEAGVFISASGFIFGFTATQSAQCSCVAGGSDEVAGWRWGFPALAWAWPWHSNGWKTLLGHKRSVCLPATRQDFHHPTQLGLISPVITQWLLSKEMLSSFHLSPFWWHYKCGVFSHVSAVLVNHLGRDGNISNMNVMDCHEMFVQTFMISRW